MSKKAAASGSETDGVKDDLQGVGGNPYGA